MSIAVIGASGQLGVELSSSLQGDVVLLSKSQIDLANTRDIESVLDAARPNTIINAAAYNLVDRAEDEPDLAYVVNALGPRALAKYCAARGITLLHVKFHERLSPTAMRGVLQGYRERYGALRDMVTETEPTFREDLLGEVDVLELLTAPVAELAAHWRSGTNAA